MKEAFEMN